MKDKNKRILKTLGYGALDIMGYGMGITLSLNTTNILLNILKDGQTTITHTWWTPKSWKPSLKTEIGLTIGSFFFFIYKFIKNMVDREKLLKHE